MEQLRQTVQNSMAAGRKEPVGPVKPGSPSGPDGPAIEVSASVRRRPSRESGKGSTGFLPLFWSVATLIAAYTLFTMPGRPGAFTLGALTIALAAMLPAWFWCSGRAKGLPIYPIYAATFVITCSYQLLTNHETILEDYDEAAVWLASLTIAGFLTVTTVVWLLWLRRPRRLPAQCRGLQGQKGTVVLLAVLAISALYTLVDHAGWAAAALGMAATTARQFIRGLTSLAVFILSMRWGTRALTIPQRTWLITLLVAYCAIDAASLFLVTAITSSLMMLAGFAVGRKAIPWGKAALVVSIFGFLHLGKGQIRLDRWGSDLDERPFINPAEIPVIYAEWAADSLDAIVANEAREEQRASILSRSSTIQLMLQAQDARLTVPFLNGETYALIPDALIPRLLHPGKTSPHDSTTILNIHYGNQTLESARVTSIGWGMLNESFANFGFKGCFYLAVILGSFYGFITRWSIGLPLTSIPALVGVFTITFAVETEMTAAIFITAYAQGLFALLLVALFFAERQPLHNETAVAAVAQANLPPPRPAPLQLRGPRALPWWKHLRPEHGEPSGRAPQTSPPPASGLDT